MKLKDFFKSGHPPTLFTAFLYFDTSFMAWVLMGVLGIFIAKDFGLSASQKGLLAALPILGGTLVRIPLGLMVDYVGPKKTGIWSQAFVLIPLLGTWLWGFDFGRLAGFGLLLGMAGGSFSIAMPLASRWYSPQQQGIALGLVGVGTTGSALASLLAPGLAEWVGWRNVFGLMLIPAAVTLALFSHFAKESPNQPRPKPMGDYFHVFREIDTLWFCLFYGITFGGFVGLASFLGIFFYDQYGVSKINAGYLTALCALTGGLVRPIGGYLADRFGGVRMLTIFFGSLSVLMLGISCLPPLVFTVCLVFFSMACMGMGNGSVFQLVPLRFQKEIGVMTGIVGAAGGLGGFFLPTLLGYCKQRLGSYGVGFLIFAGVSLAGVVVLRKVQKNWCFIKPHPVRPLDILQPDLVPLEQV